MKKWLEYSNNVLDLFLQTYFIEEAEHAENRGNVFDALIYAKIENKINYGYLVARFEDFSNTPMFLAFIRPKKVSDFFTSENIYIKKRVKLSEDDEDYKSKGRKTKVKEFSEPNPSYCADDRSKYMSSSSGGHGKEVSGDRFTILSDCEFLVSYDDKIRHFGDICTGCNSWEHSEHEKEFGIYNLHYSGEYEVERLKEPKTLWELISGRKEKFDPKSDWFITDKYGKDIRFLRFTDFDVDKVCNILPGDKKKNTPGYLAIARPDLIDMSQFMKVLIAAEKEKQGAKFFDLQEELEQRIKDNEVWKPNEPSKFLERRTLQAQKDIELYIIKKQKEEEEREEERDLKIAKSALEHEIYNLRWKMRYNFIDDEDRDEDEEKKFEEERLERLKREEEERLRREEERVKREEEIKQRRKEAAKRAAQTRREKREREKEIIRQREELISNARKDKSLIPQIEEKYLNELLEKANKEYAEICREHFENKDEIRKSKIIDCLSSLNGCADELLRLLDKMGLFYMQEEVAKEYKESNSVIYKEEETDPEINKALVEIFGDEYERRIGRLLTKFERFLKFLEKNNIKFKPYHEQVKEAMNSESILYKREDYKLLEHYIEIANDIPNLIDKCDFYKAFEHFEFMPIESYTDENGKECKRFRELETNTMSCSSISSNKMHENLIKCAVPSNEVTKIINVYMDWGIISSFEKKYANAYNSHYRYKEFMDDKINEYFFEKGLIKLYPEYDVAPLEYDKNKWIEYLKNHLWVDPLSSPISVMFNFLLDNYLTFLHYKDYSYSKRPWFRMYNYYAIESYFKSAFDSRRFCEELMRLTKKINFINDTFIRAFAIEFGGSYDVRCWRFSDDRIIEFFNILDKARDNYKDCPDLQNKIPNKESLYKMWYAILNKEK